jgi:hypothetical protein
LTEGCWHEELAGSSRDNLRAVGEDDFECRGALEGSVGQRIDRRLTYIQSGHAGGMRPTGRLLLALVSSGAARCDLRWTGPASVITGLPPQPAVHSTFSLLNEDSRSHHGLDSAPRLALPGGEPSGADPRSLLKFLGSHAQPKSGSFTRLEWSHERQSAIVPLTTT